MSNRIVLLLFVILLNLNVFACEIIRPLGEKKERMRIYTLEKDAIYQACFGDETVMSLVKSENGWIVIDPSADTNLVKKAWDDFKNNMDSDEISAVLVTNVCGGEPEGVAGIVDAESVWRISQSKYAKLSKNAKKLAKAANAKVLFVAPNGCNDETSSDSSLEPSFYLEFDETVSEEMVVDGIHLKFQKVSRKGNLAGFDVFIKEYKTLYIGKCTAVDADAFANSLELAVNAAEKYFEENVAILIGVNDLMGYGNGLARSEYSERESARRFVNDMGGEDATMKKARQYFSKGDYRWTVEMTRLLMINNPANKECRLLQADALEKIASLENGSWKNVFVAEAMNLRKNGRLVEKTNSVVIKKAAAVLRTMSPEYIFEYFSMLLDGTKALKGNVDISLNVKVADEYYNLYVVNGVFYHRIIEEPVEYVTFVDVDELVDNFERRMLLFNPDNDDYVFRKMDYTPMDVFYRYFEPLEL